MNHRRPARCVKLSGLPEVIRHNQGSSRVIDSRLSTMPATMGSNKLATNNIQPLAAKSHLQPQLRPQPQLRSQAQPHSNPLQTHLEAQTLPAHHHQTVDHSIPDMPIPHPYPRSHAPQPTRARTTPTPTPTWLSPTTEQSIAETVKRLEIVTQNLESMMGILLDKFNLVTYDDTPPETQVMGEPDVLADISISSREYLNRQNFLNDRRLY